jgi:hypothetical protein
MDLLIVVLGALLFSIGGLCGEQIERGWWRRNLTGPQPPGICRRLGL